ncbi:hypothetical protein FNV43_RR17157 [Rhamnella rubrinervis]|uniref:Zinc-finger domain-containing protein n=1 Tax=Rhamnella rubrinervis TaxID=2594499 RepID=A0A8K0GRM7_9ROSA|nr:hypothetical protein FNV43_RR17157 [Rhamnella rubrinervis]
MPTLRRRSRILPAPGNPGNPSNDDQQAQSTHTQTISQYEQSREERIKQNLQKMQKLGILDLSQKLNSQIRPKRTPKDPSRHKSTPASSALPPTGPTRRSSRLQNVTPISYSEVDALKQDKALLKNKDIVLEVGSKPEIYTEEHKKLLGNTEKTWVLFVDGYGNDGNRIYDPIKGKTCHQCRQKTLGHRTHCCKCNMVQGQFCGDCLYMRYGEHVLEALENPDWICPACRGICNCSLCRKAKGWPPTGCLYKKVSGLGFKSVAHYLIQTHLQESDMVKGSDISNQVSAKRSLQFTDREALSKESLKVNSINLASSKSQFEDQSTDEFKSEKERKKQSIQNEGINCQISAKRLLPFSDTGPLSQNMGPCEAEHKVDDQFGLLKSHYENHCDGFKSEKETEIAGIECFSSETTFSKPKRKPAQTIEPSMDTIAGRLSQRRKIGNGQDNALQKPKEKVLCCKQGISEILTGMEVEQEKEQHFTGSKQDIDGDIMLEENPKMKKPFLATKLNSDSIAGRLKLRGRNHDNGGELPRVNDSILDVKQHVENFPSDKEVEKDKEILPSDIKHDGGCNTPSERSPKLKHKRALANALSLDSIAGRLRQRRRKADGHDADFAGMLTSTTSSIPCSEYC